jgi:hydroxylamine reductase
MFCHPCKQTAHGVGCNAVGIRGKQPDVAALQNHLLYGLQSLAFYAHKARKLGAGDPDLDHFLFKGLFATVTNVDFDGTHLEQLIRTCHQKKEQARALYEKAFRDYHTIPAPSFEKDQPGWNPCDNLVEQGRQYGIEQRHSNADVRSLMEILVHGLKGMAACADHNAMLGKIDDEVTAFFHRALAATCDKTLGLRDFIELALECGRHNLTVMALLKKGHMAHHGHTEPTAQRSTS